MFTCRIFSCGKRVFAMTSAFSWQTLFAFALFHSVLQGQIMSTLLLRSHSFYCNTLSCILKAIKDVTGDKVETETKSQIKATRLLRHVQERGTIAKRQSPAMPVDLLWTTNSFWRHILKAGCIWGPQWAAALPLLDLNPCVLLGWVTQWGEDKLVLPQLKAPGLASPPTQLRSKSIQVWPFNPIWRVYPTAYSFAHKFFCL